MLRFLSIFVDICLLRAGPQRLPASSSLLVLCLLAYFISAVLTQHLSGRADAALPFAFSVTGLLVALTLAVLGFRGLLTRARQTISALAGTGALISLVMLPMTVVIASQTNASLGPFISITWLIVFFWSFALDGHILRHALSVSFTVGVLVATLYFAVGVSVNHWLFGSP